MGMMVEGFPNLLMLMGPHTALGNIPRSIEYNVEWVTGLMRHVQAHGLTRADFPVTGTSGSTVYGDPLRLPSRQAFTASDACSEAATRVEELL